MAHATRAPGQFFLPLALVFVISLPAVTTRINASDEIEFFAWLRSWVFDRDVDFENEYRHFYEVGPARNPGFHETFLERTTETGRRLNFAPIGSAILWAPFYGVGHVIARAAGAPTDGFSWPYLAAVAYGSAVYGWLGLLLTADLVRRLGWPPLRPSLAVWLGTPLVFYMYVAPGFSHACSAFAVSLFLWLWLRVRDTWTPAGLVALGGAGAIMAMVREQDIFFLAGPALDFARHAVASPEAARRRQLFRAAVTGVACFLLGYAPQLVAYYALNGHFGPTTTVARKMSWTSPHFLSVLVDPEHGFFMWTPLALLAAGGLGWLAFSRGVPRTTQWIGRLAVLMFVLQVYVTGSVESWTVAGSFGQRRFVATTPLLALGVAAVFSMWGDGGRARVFRTLVVALAIWWNLGLMAQFGLHRMDRQRLALVDNARVTFIELPPHIPSIVWRYLSDRSSFFGLPRQ
jgi:hypothetical protein